MGSNGNGDSIRVSSYVPVSVDGVYLVDSVHMVEGDPVWGKGEAPAPAKGHASIAHPDRSLTLLGESYTTCGGDGGGPLELYGGVQVDSEGPLLLSNCNGVWEQAMNQWTNHKHPVNGISPLAL
ncbi:hypothetical protein SUGI_1510160 [Cryptomeria japonica]|uniref:Uncharacterized protein n=1 Tax=Cryptomeria japonica TaxID=3369 RepID=A0AAD3NUG1_CRYJA|nr:hypothetical protein SUGI_1492340 [Cryptomeria japonica]GLJ59248.1 hypothetical protein SUGI_1499140 [Cryptomeria japonica]GLJ59478.1 hypothetical protein SUGI_1510160 [Cryptomeria japonica]